MLTSPTVNKPLRLACGWLVAEPGLLTPAPAHPLASFLLLSAQGMPKAVGTRAGSSLGWQVGKEMLTQRPFLLAIPPLLVAASSQWLCPAPVFLTCFLSLFLLTSLGQLLGTEYSAKMCPWGRGQVYSSRRREQH